jgi:hypothetical protein
MSLQTRIIKGRLKLPKRLMVHGPPGVGKSTFAAGAEDVLFIDPEKRTGHLDVARVEPEAWLDIMVIGTEIIKEKAAKTVVFSTVDYMQSMVHKYLAQRNGVNSFADLCSNWGPGYQLATDEFRKLSNMMEAMRNVGITCVLEAHSDIKEFKNPDGDNYDVWQIKLDKRVKSVLTERCDAVGFATFEDFARKSRGDSKAKAVTTGERVLKFGHHPAYETKRGFDLPESMPLEWSAWAAAVEKSYGV